MYTLPETVATELAFLATVVAYDLDNGTTWGV